MLGQYDLFLEEATYALYVSLDASFALIRRKMEQQGHKNPSAYEAAEWIDAAFGVPYDGYRYFEDYYDDRIKALHPNSRFGSFPFPPLAADDSYGLVPHLREVYKYLILGEIDKEALSG